MIKYFSLIFVLFLVIFTSSYCFASDPIENQHKGHPHEMTQAENIDTSVLFSVNGERSQIIELSGKAGNGIRVIEVKASRYKFEPDPIVVNLGEKVRLVVTSSDVTHGLAIDEFKVKLSVPAGKTGNVEFSANKKGTFHVYCSVYCGPGHSHMHANFIVK